jgi:hypothetical protein
MPKIIVVSEPVNHYNEYIQVVHRFTTEKGGRTMSNSEIREPAKRFSVTLEPEIRPDMDRLDEYTKLFGEFYPPKRY